MRAVDERCVSDLYAMCMSDRLRELTAFVRAGETGSFSRVARELGVSQPSISRMVADLEARLGVKLLLRTTRRVTPTDAGRVFLERARQILGDLDDAENAARGVDGLRGTLRVALSGALGTREVIPRLPSFAAQHPNLGIELLMSDRTEDLIAEGADMALRLGPLADSGFGTRLLGKAPRLAVASPAYLARSGVSGVDWSGPMQGQSFASVKAAPGPQPAIDALLKATRLPAKPIARPAGTRRSSTCGSSIRAGRHRWQRSASRRRRS